MYEQLKSVDSFYISDIKIDYLDYNIIVSLIENTIVQSEKLIINYANAYSIVVAEKDVTFKSSLTASNLVHPDGIGIWLASKILNKNKRPVKFNWTDYGFDFLKICGKKGWKIFFLGSTEKILIRAKKNLKRKYPLLKLMGTANGYEGLDDSGLVDSINRLNVDILYVGLGTPKQETWIYNNASELNCKVIHSVGDLFSLYAGEKTRGSKLFQRIGLEWFFRLLRHPVKYFKRYVIGIPQFFIILTKRILKDL